MVLLRSRLLVAAGQWQAKHDSTALDRAQAGECDAVAGQPGQQFAGL